MFLVNNYTYGNVNMKLIPRIVMRIMKGKNVYKSTST